MEQVRLPIAEVRDFLDSKLER